MDLGISSNTFAIGASYNFYYLDATYVGAYSSFMADRT